MILLDLAARTILLPVLIWQAASLRRFALKLPEAAGPRTGVTGRGPMLRLLIIGDSSAAGVGVQTQDQALLGHLVAALAPSHQVHWQLHAKSGATTAATLRSMGALECDIAVVALGVNDVTRGLPRMRWLRQQNQLIARLRRAGARQIVLSGVPPMQAFPLLPQPLSWVLGRQALRFDLALRALISREADLDHIPLEIGGPEMMAEDGFHPGPKIYALWAERVAAKLNV